MSNQPKETKASGEEQFATGRFAADILDPIDRDTFFAEYWEQKPLYVERSNTHQFEHLISEREIESLLSTHSLAYPSVQLSKTGHSIPVDHYTDANQFIVADRIVESYRAGCTIVMSLVQNIHPPLMDFCRAIQASFSMPCQTNAYLSPPGNQGFNPHHDTHDVFILQVSGKKAFSFYNGGAELPTVADRFNSTIHAVGDKTEEITLSAGDTLYIPRGFVHDAVADPHESSLHITLGVYPVLMQSLLNRIVTNAMQHDVRLRASVDQQLTLKQSIGGQQISAEYIKQIVLDNISDDAIESALSALHDEAALDAKPNLNNRLANVSNSTIGLSSEFYISTDTLIDVSNSVNKTKLRLHGSLVELPHAMQDAVSWLLTQERLVLRDLPGLNDEQRLALADHLVSHGVLNRVV